MCNLIELSNYDNIIDIDNENIFEFEEDYEYNSDNDEDTPDIYKHLKKNDNIFEYSEITDRIERINNYDNSTMANIKDNIKIYKYNYYYNMSWIFCNCISLLSLPDISQ